VSNESIPKLIKLAELRKYRGDDYAEIHQPQRDTVKKSPSDHGTTGRRRVGHHQDKTKIKPNRPDNTILNIRPTTTAVANEYDGSRACRPNNMVEIIRNGSKNGLLNAALMTIWATINTLPAPAQNPVSDRMHIFLSLIRHDYL